jgi:hypothetical protein
MSENTEFFIVNKHIYLNLGFSSYKQAISEIVQKFKLNQDYIVVKKYENSFYRFDDESFKLKYSINTETYDKLLVKSNSVQGKIFRQDLINRYKPFDTNIKMNSLTIHDQEMLKIIGKIKVIITNDRILIVDNLTVRQIKELLRKSDIPYNSSDNREKLLENILVETLIF